MIVIRPQIGERKILEKKILDIGKGLVGDTWLSRGSRHTPDNSSETVRQITMMSIQVISAITPDRKRWPEAGDQLMVDMDLSTANFSAGSIIALGDAHLEISAVPHTGCKKFLDRFGKDALRFVSENKEESRRGLNAGIIKDGEIKIGDKLKILNHHKDQS